MVLRSRTEHSYQYYYTFLSILVVTGTIAWTSTTHKNNNVVVDCFVPVPIVTTSTRSIPTTIRSITTTTTTTRLKGSSNSNSNSINKKKNTKEELLSDVDARVLQSMLREQKLDVQTEDGIKKLLQRGIVKETPVSNKNNKVKPDSDDDESMFSSKAIKTLTDTKLWKKLSLQASNTFESLSIWVTNKIEQDVKVLAAIGLFAWDRAVQDVARALPAAGNNTKTNNKQYFLLTNSSSGTSSSKILQAMNRPEDEIQYVSKEILNILGSGGNNINIINSNNRGLLRTAAPAGIKNVAERQKRAYKQRTKIQKQNTNIGKVLGGNVIDTAWELRTELKAETNLPGYKTKPIRKALQAGVIATGNYLRDAQTQAKLAASKRKELLLLQQQQQQQETTTTVDSSSVSTDSTTTTTTTTMDSYQQQYSSFFDATTTIGQTATKTNNDNSVEQQQQQTKQSNTRKATASSINGIQQYEIKLLQDLQNEQQRILERLSLCISDPSNTWLSSNVIDLLDSNTDDIFAGNGMQDVVTKLILLNEDMNNSIKQQQQQQQEDNTTTGSSTKIQITFDNLYKLQNDINALCTFAKSAVSDIIANALQNDIYYGTTNIHDIHQTTTLPVVLRLDNIQTEWKDMQKKSYTVAESTTSASTSSTSSTVVDEVYQDYDFFAATVVEKSPTTHTTTNVIENDSTMYVQETQKYNAKSATTASVSKEEETMYVSTTDYVDVIPDAIFDVIPESASFQAEKQVVGTINENDKTQQVMDAASAGLVAEIISDEDFDKAVGVVKATKQVSETDDEEEKVEEMNPAMVLTLRSLDVIFFVLEKILIVGVPNTIIIAKTALTRYDNIQRNGKGYQGWKELSSNLASTKNRY